MHPFALSRADDPATAIATHARDPHLAFIAGGTDLLGLIKDRAALPERLLDINGLPDMARIEAAPDGGLRIGALARMSDVAADPAVRRGYPRCACRGCSGREPGPSQSVRSYRGAGAGRRSPTLDWSRRSGRRT